MNMPFLGLGQAVAVVGCGPVPFHVSECEFRIDFCAALQIDCCAAIVKPQAFILLLFAVIFPANENLSVCRVLNGLPGKEFAFLQFLDCHGKIPFLWAAWAVVGCGQSFFLSYNIKIVLMCQQKHCVSCLPVLSIKKSPQTLILNRNRKSSLHGQAAMPQQAGLLRVIIAAASVGGILAGFFSLPQWNHLLSY